MIYFVDKVRGVKSMTAVKDIGRSIIFISHRTVDCDVADMIKDYLVNTGIPNEKIFCSSLPGNDVNEKIAPEVKMSLKESIINILILSKAYYESAYCLNEAGVVWYLDEAVTIPIGLPEISHNNMIGFLNSDYKLRRLDNDDDIAYLYDTAQEKLHCVAEKHSVITRESGKLKERYIKYIAGRDVNDDTILDEKRYKKSRTVTLPSDLCILLAYASTDPHGQIMHIRSFGGSLITTAGYEFMMEDSARETAKWEGALKELEDYGLIQATSYKREIFKLTKNGFSVADEILKEHPEIDLSQDPEIYLNAE